MKWLIFSLIFCLSFSIFAKDITAANASSYGVYLQTTWGEIFHDPSGNISTASLSSCRDNFRPRPILKHISSNQPGAEIYSSSQKTIVPKAVASKKTGVNWDVTYSGSHALTSVEDSPSTRARIYSYSATGTISSATGTISATLANFSIGTTGSGLGEIGLTLNGCSEKGGYIGNNSYCTVGSNPPLGSAEIWIPIYSPGLSQIPNCIKSPRDSKCFQTNVACFSSSHPALIFKLATNTKLAGFNKNGITPSVTNQRDLAPVPFINGKVGRPHQFFLSFDAMLAKLEGGDEKWYDLSYEGARLRANSTAHLTINIYFQNLKFALPNTGRGEMFGASVGIFDAKNRPVSYNLARDYIDSTQGYYLKAVNLREIPFGGVVGGKYGNPFSLVPAENDVVDKHGPKLADSLTGVWKHFPNKGEWNFTPYIIEAFRAAAISAFNGKNKLLVHGPLYTRKTENGNVYDKACYADLKGPSYGIDINPGANTSCDEAEVGSCCRLSVGTKVCNQSFGGLKSIPEGNDPQKNNCATKAPEDIVEATEKIALEFYSLTGINFSLENSSNHNIEFRLNNLKFSYDGNY